MLLSFYLFHSDSSPRGKSGPGTPQ
uniref:Uncharacterized protein n=1 Tax=Anguilla anguilla TaxID=7936 RepID=A0A0E9QKG9_ANGAN